jgi:hypothetical protein
MLCMNVHKSEQMDKRNSICVRTYYFKCGLVLRLKAWMASQAFTSIVCKEKHSHMDFK